MMDRRSIRTRKALRDAMVGLATERPYEEIRVQDILDRAGVGRTTFYSHFRDKEDLLVTLFLEMMDRIESHIDPASPLALPSAEELFDHFMERAELCRGLRRGDKLDTLYRAGESHLRRYFENRLSAAGQVRASLLAAFAAGTFVTLWRWWIGQGSRIAPSEMAAIYERLVAPGLNALQAEGRRNLPVPEPGHADILELANRGRGGVTPELARLFRTA